MTLNPVLTSADEMPAVEIEFCVGDDVLYINGEAIQVETPYSVGEGVVLVPVRVITEAFGAEVLWNGDDRSVTINYPDVEIVLIIDNTVADVNGIAEKLVAAPQIKNSTTMVPLRFISETFGAEVNYDPDTGSITVTKDGDDEVGSIVEGGIESLRIGDSYFNWSMENPTGMTVYDRSSDGKYTLFMGDSYYDSIDVSIDEIDADYDFERDYYNRRYSVVNSTLVNAQKDTSDPRKRTIRIQKKDNRSFDDCYILVTDKYYFEVYGTSSADDKEAYEDFSRVISTFDVEFDKETTHDLYKGKTEEQYELYESEDLNLSLEIPGFFDTEGDMELPNRLVFYSFEDGNEGSEIILNIYSAQDSPTAEKLAEDKYSFIRDYYNPDICKLGSSVEEMKFENIEGFGFVAETSGEYSKGYIKAVYFNVGDYIYNLSVMLDLPNDNAEECADRILNSFKAEPLDPDEFGTALYNIPAREGDPSVVKGEGWEITIPAGYVCKTGDEIAHIGLYGNYIYVDFEVTDSDAKSLSDVKDLFMQVSEMADYYSEFKIVQPVRQRMIGKYQYFEVACAMTDYLEEDMIYMHLLGTYAGGKMITFALESYEHTYSEKLLEDLTYMAESLVISK